MATAPEPANDTVGRRPSQRIRPPPARPSGRSADDRAAVAIPAAAVAVPRDTTNEWVRLDEENVVFGVVLSDRLNQMSAKIVLVASGRKDAIARIKAAGGHGVRLTTNDSPPHQTEIDAAIASVDRITWRPWLEGPVASHRRDRPMTYFCTALWAIFPLRA